MTDYAEIILAFRDFMAENGLITSDEIIGDGKRHRFHVDGDSKGKENGWYILHVDENPAGMFGTWKDSDRWISWVSNPTRKLTASERRELEKKIATQRKEHEEEQAKIQLEAQIKAQALWDQSETKEHGYLSKKAIKPYDTRVDQDGGLLIPMFDRDGKLWNFQRIDLSPTAKREKSFQFGARVDGCYFSIFEDEPDLSVILICEGFATGASLFAATDLPTIIAFNTANLLSVSKVIRSKFPKASLIICADNDEWTTKPVLNPGVHFAKNAAIEVKASVAIPVFKWTENKPTDFNDLAQAEGLNRVAEIIESVKQDAFIEAQAQLMMVDNAPLPEVPSGSDFYPGAVDFPHLGKRGPLATIENVEALLRATNVRARYDVIRKDMDIIIPGTQYLIDTAKNDKLTWLISQAALCQLPVQRVPEFVSHIAGQSPYNPVAEWVLSKPWDQASRLQEFFNTIQAKKESDEDANDSPLKEILMRKWMISAIAAAFHPKGVSAHGVLTLQGDQNLGKTMWFKTLVPPELELIADGLQLDPKDKDSVYNVVTHWLVELGEIDATFRKADIAQLKSFLTKDRDVLRRPYARAESAFARRTVFFASVNPEDFLADPTGNRRFWTIQCESINFKHGLDMQQVWAEFYALYQTGEPWVLTIDEFHRLNAHNREFEAVNAAEELVATRLNWAEPKTLWTQRTATEIALAIGLREPNEKTLKQVAKAVREKTQQMRQRDTKGRHVYIVPDLLKQRAE